MIRYRKWAIASVALIALVGLFCLDPVRGLAANALQIFRMDQVQVVHFDPAEVQQLANTLRTSGQKIDLDSLGAFANESLQDCRLVNADAAMIGDKRISLPAKIGSLTRTGSLELEQGFKLLATPKVAAINSMLAGLGSRSPLPTSLDGRTFTLQVSGTVSATYTQPGMANGVSLHRSLSPVLTVPDGVDVEQVRKALLDIPVLPEGMRSTLAGVDIHGNTLLIPDFGASQYAGSAKEVTVNGNPGVLITLPNSGHTALIWMQSGIWNCLSGDFTAEQGLALAASVE